MAKSRVKRKWRLVVRWICWVLLLQFVLVNISSALYAYRLTYFYETNSLSLNNKKRNVFAKTWRLFTGPKYSKSEIKSIPGFPYDTVTLKTKDGLAIEAWKSKADKLKKGTVLLFHGIGGAKDYLISEAEAFRNLGFNVMMVDFRGHGNSSGHTTTLGVKESEEVKLAFDYVRQLGEKRIFIWGGSMGAVAVAHAIGQYQLNVSGIILEAPFASIQSHLKAKARVLGFPGQPFAFFTTLWIGIERGFNGFSARTDNYARKIHCPVLVQWGSLDDYVLKWEIEKVFSAVSSTDKKLVVYENGMHESLLRRDSLLWVNEVGEFLEK